MNNKKYRCPCCGYLTLDDEPGHFDICPVCFWEDDNLQADDPYYEGGPNGISLNQARENYKKFGACEECSLGSVRPPTEEEKNITPIEPISDEMQKLLMKQHKLNLVQRYNNMQEFLAHTDIETKTRLKQNFQACTKLIIEELRNNGIVLDEATGKFIDISTGLPIK